VPAEAPSLKVIARAPFTVYYEGPALSLQAENRVGKFAVLPGHADFFSMLIPCDCIIETEDQELTFSITSGIITVRDDEVLLFVNM